MRAPTFWRGGDDDNLIPTGEHKTISAAAGTELLNVIGGELINDHGRYEGPDYEKVEKVLKKHKLIDNNFTDDWD